MAKVNAGYREEVGGFWVTELLAEKEWSAQLSKVPEETDGWNVLYETNEGEDLGYIVYLNVPILESWGVKDEDLRILLPELVKVKGVCERAVEKGLLKAKDDVEQLVLVSVLARDLMIDREINEGKKNQIRMRKIIPQILGGILVGSLIGLLPAEGKGRYAKGIIAMLGGLLAYQYTGRFVRWDRAYALGEIRSF